MGGFAQAVHHQAVYEQVEVFGSTAHVLRRHDAGILFAQALENTLEDLASVKLVIVGRGTSFFLDCVAERANSSGRPLIGSRDQHSSSQDAVVDGSDCTGGLQVLSV